MSRFAVNSDVRDEDSHSGEDSMQGRDRESEEDVTPPPLIPNPPWLASPAPKTPENKVDSDDDVGVLLSRPLMKQTSICISPNSSHLHAEHSAFMTPARATGSGPRPFDTSFPVFPPLNSSPIRRNQPPTSDTVTPGRSSGYHSIFMHTPGFSSSFSETRLEDELARMARGDDSPGGFFDRSALYKSPSVPGSSPNRWANQ
jgi:hypothetical protein